MASVPLGAGAGAGALSSALSTSVVSPALLEQVTLRPQSVIFIALLAVLINSQLCELRIDYLIEDG